MKKTSKKDKILAYLQDGNMITQRTSARKFNCWRLADVIFRLRGEGHDIHTDKQGGCGYAEYTLLDC